MLSSTCLVRFQWPNILHRPTVSSIKNRYIEPGLHFYWAVFNTPIGEDTRSRMLPPYTTALIVLV